MAFFVVNLNLKKRSVGMKYKKAYENINSTLVEEFSEKYKLNKKVTEYIVSMGYDTLEKFDDYINVKEIFYDPYLLKGMREAVERINEAVKKHEKILIFGDYDVDGIGATAILVLYFRSIGVDVSYYLPSRFEDGYGLSIETADKVLELFSPDLIITVDCGIACHKEVDYIKSKGVDIIVTDHHEIPPILPNCITIDIKLEQDYPFNDLCGAGVALKLVNALSDLETCKKYYTICAISTISDLVTLRDENRFIVQYGLNNFDKYCPKGVKELLKKQNVTNPTSTDIAFKLTPKLNASGRMGDASISLELYLTGSEEKIEQLCETLNNVNERRKQACDNIYNEALPMVNVKDKIIIVENDTWESGVLGIVATKLVSLYSRPVIVLTLDKRTNRYVGSARCIAGYNIFDILSASKDFLVTFGGHSMAGGLSLELDKLSPFKEFLKEYFESYVPIEVEPLYDFCVTNEEVDEAFINSLSVLEPIGVGNKKPRILLENSQRSISFMRNHNENVIVKLNNMSGVGFGLSKYFYLLNSPSKIDMMIEPYIEIYNSRKYIKFYLQEMLCYKLVLNEDFSNGSKVKNLFYDDGEFEGSQIQDGSILDITFEFDYETKSYKVIDYGNLSHTTNANTLLVCPNNFYGFDAFDNIRFLERVPSGVLSRLSMLYPNAKIIQGEKILSFDIKELDLSRNVFGKVFNFVKDIEILFKDDYTYYINVIKDISYTQFVFCYSVLSEIGVLKIVEREGQFGLKVTGEKGDLIKSIVYKRLWEENK